MTTETPSVMLHHGAPATTTVEIAEYFGKQHRDVMRSVRNLDCSEGFSLRNFAQSTFVDSRGKRREMYIVTRDGFVFLAMGFTGPQAAAFKEAYIEAFNALEARVHVAPLIQQEKYWFARRPLWPQIRTLAYEGLRNVEIAPRVQRSPSSVGNSIRRMVEVGLMDPARRYRARYSPRTAQRLVHEQQLCLDWGQAA